MADEKFYDFNITIVNEKLINIQYKTKMEFISDFGNTNIYIAIFTTSHARIRLYKQLEKIGKKAFYCDTHLVIYAIGKKEIPLGDSLGEWGLDDCLEGGKRFIKEFSSLGPKDRGIELDNKKQINKVKGFRINAETEDQINMENRLKLLKNHEEKILIDCEKFTITGNNQIKTEIIKKNMEIQ